MMQSVSVLNINSKNILSGIFYRVTNDSHTAYVLKIDSHKARDFLYIIYITKNVQTLCEPTIKLVKSLEVSSHEQIL